MKRAKWELAFIEDPQIASHVLVSGRHCLPHFDSHNDILLKVILSPFSFKKKKRKTKTQRREVKVQCHTAGQFRSWSLKQKSILGTGGQAFMAVQKSGGTTGF